MIKAYEDWQFNLKCCPNTLLGVEQTKEIWYLGVSIIDGCMTEEILEGFPPYHQRIAKNQRELVKKKMSGCYM